MAASTVQNQLDRHSEMLEDLLQTMATIKTFTFKIDRKVDHLQNNYNDQVTTAGATPEKMDVGNYPRKTGSSQCKCEKIKTEILDAINNKFLQMKAEILESRGREVRSSEGLMKEIRDLNIANNSDVLKNIKESKVSLKNEIIETIRSENISSKNEVLEEMRLQNQHNIQNDVKQILDEKIAVVKSEIEPISANLKDLRSETKSVLKQLKDFKNETNCELKQILEKTKSLDDSSQQMKENIEILTNKPDYSKQIKEIKKSVEKIPKTADILKKEELLAHFQQIKHQIDQRPQTKELMCNKDMDENLEKIIQQPSFTFTQTNTASSGKQFKTRGDFSSDGDYGEYVYNTVTQGMTVRMRCDDDGMETGELAVLEKWRYAGRYDPGLTLQRNNSDVSYKVWGHNVDIIG